MLILMAAAGPYWKYLMKNDAEEELLFRGGEIADAIGRYQRRNGNALPASLEVLVKQKFLRKEYKDPLTKDGKWRFLRPGDALVPGMPGAPPHPAWVEASSPPRPRRRGRRPSRSRARASAAAGSRALPPPTPTRACASSTAARSTASGCSWRVSRA
jgi:hypothetical protein